MDKYFLVSPENETDNLNRYFYWMRENDDNWVQFVKGVWRPKQNGDIIKLCAKVKKPFLLDWKGTWLFRPGSNFGWLNRNGRFFGCPTYYHDQLAEFMLGLDVTELENTGWVRVKGSNYYSCLKRLSAEQRNWLSIKGYKVYD